MAGLIFIVPLMAFDLWLFYTTGSRQVSQWLALQEWRKIALAGAIGFALAVWFTFFISYSAEIGLRVRGFPVPTMFFHLTDKIWTRTNLTEPLFALGLTTNLLTGLAAPFIPYKIGEFLKKVKAELK